MKTIHLFRNLTAALCLGIGLVKTAEKLSTVLDHDQCAVQNGLLAGGNLPCSFPPPPPQAGPVSPGSFLS